MTVLALTAVATGCAGGPVADGGPVAAEKPEATPTPSAARPTTARERSLLHDAEQELQRRCMRAAGFRLWAVPENPLPEARDFPYVVDDPTWAKRYGYGSLFEERIRRLRAEDPNRVYLRGLPVDRQRAAIAALNGSGREKLRAELPGGVVIGHSTTGCRVEAWRTLYGDVTAWFAAKTVVDNLGALTRQRVTTDPDFTRAMGKWSVCMRGNGLPYRSPAQARAEFLGTDEPGDTAREVRVAVQEAGCARSSGLASTVQRLEDRHGREVRREHRAEVDLVERLRTGALPSARTVLAR
ncbi:MULTISPECIES: hypothetical protein [Streptomyces]|uniref:Secreted protein n=1 Tax=Streptomyces sudanensis TaxID=436397 RepID=A0ABY4TEY8_9ACTN|nr:MULTISPECIES: hypothetical protein [Streptomyces]URN17511.1 hypothetical protein MW084_18005 [Streptomyces sudanensis]